MIPLTPSQLDRKLFAFKIATLVAISIALAPFTSAQWSPPQSTGVDANLRGISVVQTRSNWPVLWASGTKGTILRSLDNGKVWSLLPVAGAPDLDFRDIEAFDPGNAYVMSSGDGDKSRIYKTTNGGKTWKLQYSDKRAESFLDSIACRSRTHCFALSDPVDGKFVILSTRDGNHWEELPRDKMPAALPNEGAFAASGTSLALGPENTIYFGTGGPSARIFHSYDEGRSWTATETPMSSGTPSSGIFGIACHGHTVVAVGGDYKNPGAADKVAIYSVDSGKTWHLAAQQPGGYRSAVTLLANGDFIAVGPSGTDISHDAGKHWTAMEGLNINAVGATGSSAWAVGPNGMVSSLKSKAQRSQR